MRRTDILASTTSPPARVAKLADARDLKSRVSKETYRFNSGPGHHSGSTQQSLQFGFATYVRCFAEFVSAPAPWVRSRP
jgi:hypothetical protein